MTAERLDWRPLLRHLSRHCDDWFALKNLEAGLDGKGDIDGMAPETSSALVTGLIGQYLSTSGIDGLLVICDHVPGIRLHFLLSPIFLPRVEQIDTYYRISRFGAPICEAPRLAVDTLEVDGIRRTDWRTEALLHLLLATGRRGPVAKSGLAALEALEPAYRSSSTDLRGMLDRMAPSPIAAATWHAVKRHMAGAPPWTYSPWLFRIACLSLLPMHPRHLYRRALYRLRDKSCPVAMLGETGRHLDLSMGGIVEGFQRNHSVLTLDGEGGVVGLAMAR
jgi:hypothetical protein